MTITTHILLGSGTGTDSIFAFHSTAEHAVGRPVTLTGADGSELWKGAVIKFTKIRERDGSYTGVAKVTRTDKPIPKRLVDDGDPVPVTVTVDNEPSSPIEPIVVILDP